MRIHTYLLNAGILLACTTIDAQTNWVKAKRSCDVCRFDLPSTTVNGVVISDVVTGGNENDVAPAYICRGGISEHVGNSPGGAPGWFSSSDRVGCKIPYGGRGVAVPDFEFLVTSWTNASGGSVPFNAVPGGYDTPAKPGTLGQPLYYCRGSDPSNGVLGLQLGKVRPGFDGCLVPYGGGEHHISSYQVLVKASPAMPLTTVPASSGSLPWGALRAGTDANGTALYICQGPYTPYFGAATSMQPGKLIPGSGCDISYGGREILLTSYNLLVLGWENSSNFPAQPPKFDFRAGTDTDNTSLYVCRFNLGGLFAVTLPGKYRIDFNDCLVGFNGSEVSNLDYKVGFELLTSK